MWNFWTSLETLDFQKGFLYMKVAECSFTVECRNEMDVTLVCAHSFRRTTDLFSLLQHNITLCWFKATMCHFDKHNGGIRNSIC